LLLYYITDRSQFGGDEASRRKRLLEKIAEAAKCGVDFIQLREKDLSTHELELLARDAMRVVRENSQPFGNGRPATRVLINSRTDVAISCEADGVHLRSDDVTPDIVREVWRHGLTTGRAKKAIVSIACHTVSEVRVAAEKGGDFALFGPIFEKKQGQVLPAGLSQLKDACQQKIPIIALGGVSLENASRCLGVGAAGIAGIRIFQENKISQVVRQLRS